MGGFANVTQATSVKAHGLFWGEQQGWAAKQTEGNENFLLMTSSRRGQQESKGSAGWEGEALWISWITGKETCLV